MKVQLSGLMQFTPRRLSSTSDTVEDHQQQLLGENPGFVRGVDCASVVHDAMGVWAGLVQSPLGRVTNGGIAVGAGIWGANKLLHGKTALDRVEGVALLGMATNRAIDASGRPHTGLSTAAGLVQGGADLIVGGADTIRGIREHNKRRLTVGLCQMAVGACLGTSALFPSVSGVSTAVMCAATVTRQLAIGFHVGLPDK